MIGPKILLRGCLLALPLVILMAGVAHGDEVVFLVDKSFSMGALDSRSQPRYQRAISRAMEDIKFHLAVRDTVTLIFFDSAISPPRKVESLAEAEAIFRGFNPGGDTNIIDSLVYAFSELKNSSNPLIYLYTDGEQTERATMSWDELISLYNSYNGQATPDRRIKLFHIKWRESDKATSTDDALNQIENITELASHKRTWGRVEKIYFRPNNFELEYKLGDDFTDETIEVNWFSIEMSPELRNRNLKFRVEADVTSDDPVDLIVTPSLIDCSRDLDVDGSILLSFRCNGVGNLNPGEDYVCDLSFVLENTNVDLESVRVSPPSGVISGTLKVERTPSFAILDPPDGLIEIQSNFINKVEEKNFHMTWNPSAEGKELNIDYRFPIAVHAELMEVTPDGVKPLANPNRIELDETGGREFVFSITRSVRGSFEGEIGFEGFGRNEVLRVNYGMPVATIAVLPENFTSELLVPNNRADESLTSAPVRSTAVFVDFTATPETVELAPEFGFTVSFPENPELSATVDPSTVVLSPELVSSSGVAVEFEINNWAGLPAGAQVPVELTFALNDFNGPADLLSWNPEDRILRGVLTVSEKPFFDLTWVEETRIDFPELVPGEQETATFHLNWNDAAVDQDVLVDFQLDGTSVEFDLAEVHGEARIPVKSGGIHLGPNKTLELELTVKAQEFGSFQGAVAFTAFEDSKSFDVTGQVNVGQVSLFVDRGTWSIRSLAGEWTDGSLGFSLSPTNQSACGQQVRLNVMTGAGVEIDVLDEAGKSVAGKTVSLPANVDDQLRFSIKTSNSYENLSRSVDRARNFVLIEPAHKVDIRFGEDSARSGRIPIGFALMPPEITLVRDGQSSETVTVGFGADSSSIEGGESVDFTAMVDNIGKNAMSEFAQELIQVESVGSDFRAFFVATGLPAVTVEEFLADSRIGFTVSASKLKFQMTENLGKVKIFSTSGIVRVSPRSLIVDYSRKGLFMAAGAFGFLLLGAGGLFVLKRRSVPAISGYFVVEHAEVPQKEGVFDLSSFNTKICEVGIAEDGQIVFEKEVSGGAARFTSTANGVVVEAINQAELLLNEISLTERSTLFDLSTIDLGDVRLRFQLEEVTENEGAGVFAGGESEYEDYGDGLGLVDDDRDELVLEDDDDLSDYPDDQVVLEEQDGELNVNVGLEKEKSRSTESTLSETIVLEDED